MALIVYNRENSRSQEVTYKGKRTINLDSRGTVYLSKTMSIELGILGGGRVNFAHDDETDDWYICRADDSEGPRRRPATPARSANRRRDKRPAQVAARSARRRPRRRSPAGRCAVRSPRPSGPRPGRAAPPGRRAPQPRD